MLQCSKSYAEGMCDLIKQVPEARQGYLCSGNAVDAEMLRLTYGDKAGWGEGAGPEEEERIALMHSNE